MLLTIPFIVKILLSFLENFAFSIFSFSIFRIPIRYQIGRLLAFTLILATTNLLWRFVSPNNNEFFILVFTVVAILALAFLFEVPILYAILIVCCAQVAVLSIQSLISISVVFFNLFTMDELRYSDSIRNGFLFASTLVVFFISLLLQWKRVGFMLKTNRFQFENRSITARDIYLGFVFVVSISLVQGVMFVFMTTGSNYTPFFIIFLLLGAAATAGYYFIYRYNIKEIDGRSPFRRRK
jgi:hypothetical protein